MLNLEKKLELLKNSFIPAGIFAASILSFFIMGKLEPNSLLTLHFCIYALSALSIIVLLYFNQSSPLFFVITITLSYLFINGLKINLEQTYIESNLFLYLSVLVPFNFLIFYFLPERPFLNIRNVFLLLLIFAEIALAEKLREINFVPFSPSESGLSFLSLGLFAACFIVFFATSIVNGKIYSASLFFAALNVFFGFYYSANVNAITFFFAAAALTVFIGIIQNTYQAVYKDPLTNLYNRNSYIIHAKDFPLKYSIGIIAIDDYDKLFKAFRRLGLNSLVKMISLKINEAQTDSPVYRYSDDEFVVVFKNKDKNESFEELEKIRRSIAAAEFIISKLKKPVKLTVSAGVSEKKRSDANSIEVLTRAHKALQKTYKFTQNVTTKA